MQPADPAQALYGLACYSLLCHPPCQEAGAGQQMCGPEATLQRVQLTQQLHEHPPIQLHLCAG